MTKVSFLEYGKEFIKESIPSLKKEAKKRIVPLLLSSYDPDTYQEITDAKNHLRKNGYVNTFLLEELDDVNTEGEYDTKYIGCLDCLEDDENEYFVVPVFWFPQRDSCGLGHHGELVDLVHLHRTLILRAGLFYEENSKMLHHHRIIVNSKKIQANGLSTEVINFIDKFCPLIEREMLFQRSLSQQGFYISSQSYDNKRGDA